MRKSLIALAARASLDNPGPAQVFGSLTTPARGSPSGMSGVSMLSVLLDPAHPDFLLGHALMWEVSRVPLEEPKVARFRQALVPDPNGPFWDMDLQMSMRFGPLTVA